MASRRASRAPPSRGARETRSARKRRCSDDDRDCIPLFSVLAARPGPPFFRPRRCVLDFYESRRVMRGRRIRMWEQERRDTHRLCMQAEPPVFALSRKAAKKIMEWGTALASLQQQHPPPQRQPEQQSPSKNDLSRWDAVLQSFFEFSASPPPPAPPPPTQPGDEEAGNTSEGDALRSFVALDWSRSKGAFRRVCTLDPLDDAAAYIGLPDELQFSQVDRGVQPHLRHRVFDPACSWDVAASAAGTSQMCRQMCFDC